MFEESIGKEGGPAVGDVHVNTAGGGSPRPKSALPAPADMITPGRPLKDIQDEVAATIERNGGITKSAPVPQPLFVSRPLKNADAVIAWAKGVGFKTTMPADQMHVTLIYSKSPVDWMKAGDCGFSSDPNGDLKLPPGGPRQLAMFGPLGDVVVLLFSSSELAWRNTWLQEMGCSTDWPDYHPHITLTLNRGDVDISKVEAYQGPLVFGPEHFQPVKEKAMADIVEKGFDSFFKVSGVDEGLGLVFGWGIVCKENGVDYYDVQKNHIPEDAMVHATTDFMKSARVHGDMHVRGTGPELAAGMVVHSFPLTTEIAKAMGIGTSKTGWMVATAPDKAMLAKFKSGEYTGFSIGGDYIEIDGKPVGAL